jgi:hypothetical protein
VNDGSLDLFTGLCGYVNVAAGTACSGGTCDGAGHCGTGSTGGTPPPPCDDGIPCTGDVLLASGACAHYPVEDGVLCNDGLFCDQPGSCQAGACTGIAPTVAGYICPGGTCDGSSHCQ